MTVHVRPEDGATTALGVLRGRLARMTPLLAGLGVLAASGYLGLILAGRMVGPTDFGGLSALYVMVTGVAVGLFLPLEQEISRRRGHEREAEGSDHHLARRATTLSLAVTVTLLLVMLAAHPVMLRLLGGSWALFAALCVGLPGYACCFISRGVFAGTREYSRYGVQLAVEGLFRLAGTVGLALAGSHSVAAVGWLYGAAPWVALAVSLVGRAAPGHVGAERAGPLVRPLALLSVSSLASQLLINAGPLVVQLLASAAERDRAGAFLAALVVVRIPVFLFTAVQPSFLPALAAHAAADRRADFVGILRKVIVACVALTVLSTAALTGLGPVGVRVLFGFHHSLNAVTFLAMGLSAGLFLIAAVLAQALLGRGRHATMTAGWIIGIVALAATTAIPGSAVTRATVSFLCGALAAAGAFVILLAVELRRWPAWTG